MTDLEMTKLCAEVMGFSLREPITEWPSGDLYDPFHNNAQAMALVKKFELRIMPPSSRKGSGLWNIVSDTTEAAHRNLNRAIVECVAKLTIQLQRADKAKVTAGGS